MKTKIPDFYAGQKILITGGTGFMGKVLIEKLLRCCPDLDKIYLIIREKKGMSIEERWEAICKIPEIIENVTLAFHVAADIQFNESINNALVNNVKATKTFCELLLHMKDLKALLYVSTAFCNSNIPCEKSIEKVLPACQDWKVLLKLQEREPQTLAVLKEKLLCGHPNPYTWSKSLAEQIVKEYSVYYPAAIIRPSVVVGTFEEDPIRGWTDIATGYFALGLGYMTGVLRVLPTSPDGFIDNIPVDIATNAEIIAIKKSAELKSELQVYTTGATRIQPITLRDLKRYTDRMTKELPPLEQVWTPSLTCTTSLTLFWIIFYCKQLIPAAIVDMALMLTGNTPRLLRICKKIANTVRMYGDFMQGIIKFPCDNYYRLEDYLHHEDKNFFSIDDARFQDNVYENLKIFVYGFFKYYLKWDMSEKSIAAARARSKRIAIYAKIVDIIFYLALGVTAARMFL